MTHLKRKELSLRGDLYGLLFVDEGVPEMVVFACVDQDRCYFIATIGPLEEGEDFSRHRWFQVAAGFISDAHMLDLDIP